MSRKYDSATTTFSPEGRLYQVEYAMEAIGHAGAALGMLAIDGVVLAAEKKVPSKLLDNERTAHSDISSEKLYKVDDHLAVAVAGLTSDANIVINWSRVTAQRYTFAYQEPVPVEHLIQSMCDLKQGYTQYGGQRPFGVSFLYAGWDDLHGFQLYHSDPSGNYSAWKANAIGSNASAAVSMLKQEWREELNVEQAILQAIKVLGKTMDSTSLTPDKLEFATLTLNGAEPVFHILTTEELNTHLATAKELREQEEKEKEKEKKKEAEKKKSSS